MIFNLLYIYNLSVFVCQSVYQSVCLSISLSRVSIQGIYTD